MPLPLEEMIGLHGVDGPLHKVQKFKTVYTSKLYILFYIKDPDLFLSAC